MLHRSPDGDTIGSNLAMYHLLRSSGHTVTIVSKDEVPEAFMFLPEAKQIQVVPPQEVPYEQYDIFWSIDMADPKLSGGEIELPDDLKTVIVDHHISNTGWGTINVIQPDSIAAAEVLYQIINSLKMTITPQIALCLLTGLATDSGFFQYCRNERPFYTASALIEHGAAYQTIVVNLTKQRSVEDLQFIGKAIEHLTLIPEKNMCYIAIPHDVFEAYCSEDSSKTDMLTTYLSSVKGAAFGVLFVEKEPQKIRMSFRAKSDAVDVSKMAAQLGGGGHKAAAGARIDGKTLEEVIGIVTNLV